MNRGLWFKGIRQTAPVGREESKTSKPQLFDYIFPSKMTKERHEFLKNMDQHQKKAHDLTQDSQEYPELVRDKLFLERTSCSRGKISPALPRLGISGIGKDSAVGSLGSHPCYGLGSSPEYNTFCVCVLSRPPGVEQMIGLLKRLREMAQ